MAIVLHRPRYPENIGATARAMCNMGLERLIVVDPRDPDPLRIRKMATHAAGAVVDRMSIYDDLKQALAPFNYVVATTARLGKQRIELLTPSRVAQKLVPILPRNRVALLFGPEDRGLSNEALRNCQALVNIPTAAFSSLNLAQAVMVMCYELYMAATPDRASASPRLATHHELEGMYAQLREILIRISFIQPDNPDYWLNNIRRFFARLQLRAREVSIIRGICRQIDWYAKKCFRDGQQGRPFDPVPENHRRTS